MSEPSELTNIRSRGALARWLPLAGWLAQYDRQSLGRDLLAAVIVSVMLVPQALAYALLADRLRATIKRPAILAWMTRAGGGALIVMGAFTATLRRAA